MAINHFVEGDTLSGIQYTCREATEDGSQGAVLDLTTPARTVQLRWKPLPSGALQTATMIFVNDGTDGIVKYDFVESNDLVSEEMYIEARVIRTSDGKYFTSLELDKVFVRKPLS